MLIRVGEPISSAFWEAYLPYLSKSIRVECIGLHDRVEQITHLEGWGGPGWEHRISHWYMDSETLAYDTGKKVVVSGWDRTGDCIPLFPYYVYKAEEECATNVGYRILFQEGEAYRKYLRERWGLEYNSEYSSNANNLEVIRRNEDMWYSTMGLSAYRADSREFHSNMITARKTDHFVPIFEDYKMENEYSLEFWDCYLPLLEDYLCVPREAKSGTTSSELVELSWCTDSISIPGHISEAPKWYSPYLGMEVDSKGANTVPLFPSLLVQVETELKILKAITNWADGDIRAFITRHNGVFFKYSEYTVNEKPIWKSSSDPIAYYNWSTRRLEPSYVKVSDDSRTPIVLEAIEEIQQNPNIEEIQVKTQFKQTNIDTGKLALELSAGKAANAAVQKALGLVPWYKSIFQTKKSKTKQALVTLAAAELAVLAAGRMDNPKVTALSNAMLKDAMLSATTYSGQFDSLLETLVGQTK